MTRAARPPHLVLFFTRGMSLKAWDDVGMFDREVALYRTLRPSLAGVTFVTYGGADDLDYAGRLDGIRIVCNRHDLSLEWYLRQVRWILRLARGSRTVVKSNQVTGADLALEAARRAGRRFIARCGYLLSDFAERQGGEGSPGAAAARDLERRVFTGADHVIVTTAAMRDRVRRDYGVADARVTVVPNYVETERFRPEPSPQRKPNRLVFIGRLDTQKNPLALVEAVAGLDVELVMVGAGPLREPIEGMIRERGLPVSLLGNVPNRDLPALLNSAALFVLPSHYEGHPKALLEAMACGLPVVGADAPGIRELIRHGENGYLCRADAAGLRAAITELLGNPALMARLGQQARGFVEEGFSLARVARRELDLLCA